VAKQVRRLLEAGATKNPASSSGKVTFYTSGDPISLESMLPVLLGEDGQIEKVKWLDDHVVARER
jgi:hypothetical protein